MNKDHLNDVAKATLVQKDELAKSEDKLTQVRLKIKEIDENLEENELSLKNMDDMLDKALFDMRNLLSNVDVSKISDEEIQAESLNIENQLAKIEVGGVKQIQKIDKLEDVKFDGSWEEYISSVNQYIQANNLLTNDDPFKDLMSKTQRLELQKRIKEEFSYKNAKCDKYDYMIAGTCGILSGLIDVIFVGIPTDSKLGKITDATANKLTEKFAEILGWDKNKALERGSDTTKSAIGFLEDKFKVNYDQATTSGKKGTGGAVENLSMSNHHLKSLGHSPDPVGLFFSILNQFTNTSSFVSNGKIITIDTENFELKGSNVISKIFCGFYNWFGHLASDWVGSSGANGRGSGVPIPFYNLFLLCNFGEFGQHKQTLATIATKVFEQGYDFRHGLTMAIPVVINELLIRFMYVIKARFYHKKDWKECIPSDNIPELRRMLLVGHGALCLVDGIDAGIRSGGDPVQFLLRTNLIGWVRFGHLSLKELNAYIKSGKIDIEKVDEYLDNEFKAMLRIN